MSRHTFCKSQRVTRPADFSRAFNASNRNPKQKIISRYFVVPTYSSEKCVIAADEVKRFSSQVAIDQFVCELDTHEQVAPRLGVVVSKKVSKLAVDRNRIKRVVRESFRLASLPSIPIDVIVVAKWQAKTVDNSALNKDLAHVWRRVHHVARAYCE